MLRRRREAARKRIRVQSPLHFSICPWISATLVENCRADNADVFRVMILLRGVRFAHWSKSKRRDRFGALGEILRRQVASAGS